MQKCNQCGKDFYSDSEFNEHETRHWLEKVAIQNGQLFSNIDWRLGFLAVVLIKGQEHCTFKEALKKYTEYHDKFNAYLVNPESARTKEDDQHPLVINGVYKGRLCEVCGKTLEGNTKSEHYEQFHPELGFTRMKAGYGYCYTYRCKVCNKCLTPGYLLKHYETEHSYQEKGPASDRVV